MTTATSILIRHNYVQFPEILEVFGVREPNEGAIATVLMNLAYYGRALSVESYKQLVQLTPSQLGNWWVSMEKELKEITGANRKIEDFVVYKNFPAEVLEKSVAEYWVPQLLMYWGFPSEMFAQDIKPRLKMDEKKRPVVLRLAKASTLKDILDSYVKAPARWKDAELEDVLFLTETYEPNVAQVVFKENLVRLAASLISKGRNIKFKSATDVLRLAAGLSDGDVSLRTPNKFKSFKKPMRRFILTALEGTSNLEDDVARRPELWKRLLHQLHPGDYRRQFPRTVKVNNELYHDRLETFNSKVETALVAKDEDVLSLLADRPGEFRRRLAHTLSLFGGKAVRAFTDKDVLSKLTVAQVVSLRTYLETVNDRKHRTFPPKGNWNKLQIADARPIHKKHVASIVKALGKQLAKRVPKVGMLDEATSMVKLPNNGEEGPYTRGTTFPIPEDVKFIRSASYWKVDNSRYTWYDNGWNFFDANWKSVGSCCWITPYFPGDRATYASLRDPKRNKDAGAVFSGDPVVASGKATQMIDLYPERLVAQGVRYAVWNILCFSRLKFSEAEDVFAALQWGEDAEKGKLFEPSRAQVTFPVKGETYTKFIVLLDLVERKMIFLDANLKGNTSSAESNGPLLEKTMPAFMEYIKSLPSVHDLFRESVSDKSDTHILYSDKETKLDGESAYVFRPENKENKYKVVDINNVLT